MRNQYFLTGSEDIRLVITNLFPSSTAHVVDNTFHRMTEMPNNWLQSWTYNFKNPFIILSFGMHNENNVSLDLAEGKMELPLEVQNIINAFDFFDEFQYQLTKANAEYDNDVLRNNFVKLIVPEDLNNSFAGYAKINIFNTEENRNLYLSQLNLVKRFWRNRHAYLTAASVHLSADELTTEKTKTWDLFLQFLQTFKNYSLPKFFNPPGKYFVSVSGDVFKRYEKEENYAGAINTITYSMSDLLGNDEENFTFDNQTKLYINLVEEDETTNHGGNILWGDIGGGVYMPNSPLDLTAATKIALAIKMQNWLRAELLTLTGAANYAALEAAGLTIVATGETLVITIPDSYDFGNLAIAGVQMSFNFFFVNQGEGIAQNTFGNSMSAFMSMGHVDALYNQTGVIPSVLIGELISIE